MAWNIPIQSINDLVLLNHDNPVNSSYIALEGLFDLFHAFGLTAMGDQEANAGSDDQSESESANPELPKKLVLEIDLLADR